ncbi:MAG TPA: 23S rRNA (adenine(2030)-N(6))-methyltransferase RlmJ [Halioglobus sp.]
MLSYRHAFHAGNHADVLKHLVEVLILQYLVQKQGKPLRYIDTHAGAGCYALREAFASKNREYDSGIARLWQRSDLPTPLAGYVELVRSFNSGGKLSHYPGSPAIAARILHANHRLQLFELHPDDANRLERWAQRDRRIKIQQDDGFTALKAILPPPEKRALVMVDPPYEMKTDYATALSALQMANKKFATGVYALWYPLLALQSVAVLVRKLEALPVKSLLVELPVQAAGGAGMYGSGVFIINPPWPLQQQLQDCLPYLHKVLAHPGAPPWRLINNSA